MSSGFVYLVQRADDLIKIGWTSAPRERVQQLEREHGDLHVVACVLGGRAEERLLHRRWQHLRVEGEWFAPCDDMWERAEAGVLFERRGGLCRFERAAA